jgi:hypothetical protein
MNASDERERTSVAKPILRLDATLFQFDDMKTKNEGGEALKPVTLI